MGSVREHHPDFLRIVILADQADGYFDPEQEDFLLVASTAIPLPRSRWFHFKYDILELSTGIKPYALEMLLDRYELDRIIYLDPDIKIYHALDPVTEALAQSDILLTPHLLEPIDDALRPNELDILRAGSYNLGFIALSNGENVRSFLRWWQRNVRDQCVIDLSQGLFVDQRWIDLVPGMFARVRILRDHPGLNVAYWNIHGRPVERRGAEFWVKEEPLYFFHFSGLHPCDPEGFSRHQNRFRTSALGDGSLVVRSYAQEVVEQGFAACREWPCAYDFFDDGTRIPPVARAILRQKPLLEKAVEDPFSPAGLEAFVETWNEIIRGPDGRNSLTRLAYRIYQLRTDLQVTMPEVFGAHWQRFLRWMLNSGKSEYRLPEIFLTPVRELLGESESAGAIGSAAPPNTPAASAALAGAPVIRDERSPNGSFAQPTTLSHYIYQSRLDLRQAFPDAWGRDSLRYLNWLLSYGRCEYQLDDIACQPFVDEWDRLLAGAPTPLHSWWHRTKLAAYSVSARRSSQRRPASYGPLSNGRPAAGLRAARALARQDAGTAATTAPSGGPRILGADGRFGINAVGYVDAETGVGEVVRTTIRAAQSAGVATAVKRVADGGARREQDLRSDGDEAGIYPVNVVHINADQAPLILPSLDAGLLRGRYNIGYWCWEIDEFPERFSRSFDYFDEIWALSRFSQNAIARQSPVPVVCIPPAVEIEDVPARGRTYFSLPSDAFLVLTAFDMASVFERKNPLAVVRAFVEALGKDETSHLVVKVSNGQKNPAAMRSLVEACAGRCVTLIDKVISRSDVYALLQTCDCFVSLHRAEGFGLAIAEAMYLGKPVIATGYSGNMDFMTAANSFLAGYRLVSVPPNCDPYPTTAQWADPAVADAVEHLRVVRRNPARREEIARAGKADIQRLLSRQSVGREIRRRLERLHALAGQ